METVDQVGRFLCAFAISHLLQNQNLVNVEIFSFPFIFITIVSNRIAPFWAAISEIVHSPYQAYKRPGRLENCNQRHERTPIDPLNTSNNFSIVMCEE